jgi:hypothetical protein
MSIQMFQRVFVDYETHIELGVYINNNGPNVN